MKKFLALAAAAATLAISAPASAAVWDHGGQTNINARQAQLEQRIEFGARSGRLTRSEAFQLRADMRNIAFVEARYRRGGLNYAERADLDRRLDRVSFNLERQLNDRDHRGDHRGRF